MKKILAIFLFFFYALASSGATVELHYCMDKLSGWDLHIAANTSCSSGCTSLLKAKKGCCSNQELRLRIDHDQQVTFYQFPGGQHFPGIQPVYASQPASLPAAAILQPSYLHDPPGIIQSPCYLLYCNFRI